MSGQWEQYVDQATDAVMAANYMAADEITKGLVRADVEVALAAVAPLIAEDTRTRMVEAAAAAVKREGAASEREKVAEEVIARVVARRSEITPGRPGWVYFTEAIGMVNEVCGQSDPPARSDSLPDGCTSTHPMASHIPCRKAAGHPGDHESRNGRNWHPRDIGNGASS